MALVAAYIPKSGTAVLSSDGQNAFDVHFGSLPDHALGNDCVLGFMVTTDHFPDLRVQVILNDGDVMELFQPAGHCTWFKAALPAGHL
jgi:hypothetical protein